MSRAFVASLKTTESNSATTSSSEAVGTDAASANSNKTETTEQDNSSTENSTVENNVQETSTTQDTSKVAVWHEPVYETQTVVKQVPKYKQVEIMETKVCCVCNNCGEYLYTQEELDNHFSASHTGGYHETIYHVGTGEYQTVGDGYEEQTVTEQVLVKEGYWSYE